MAYKTHRVNPMIVNQGRIIGRYVKSMNPVMIANAPVRNVPNMPWLRCCWLFISFRLVL